MIPASLEQPVIYSEHLELRPFRETDAAEVQRLAGDYEVARTTLNIPHPYPDGVAEQWIASRGEKFLQGAGAYYAIVRRAGLRLVGSVGIGLQSKDKRGELGYWIGYPYWGNGFATDATSALIDYGFGVLGLNRVEARHLASNRASGRVLDKVGLKVEGRLRQHDLRSWGYEDVIVRGLLRDEWSGG